MRRSLITMAAMISLGVVATLPYSTSSWAEGWGSVPRSPGAAPSGGVWSPWRNRGYGHRGVYPGSLGPTAR